MWKMKTPQRVRVFTWIVAHGKLLTNLKRWKRRLTDCPDCARCNRESKDVLHAVKDCNWAREVWECLILSELLWEFFSLELGPLGDVDAQRETSS